MGCCNNNSWGGNGWGGNGSLWIIILIIILFSCGGCGNGGGNLCGCGNNCGCGCGNNCGGNNCEIGRAHV